MTYYDKLKRLKTHGADNYWAQRVRAELEYMTCLSSTKNDCYHARLEEALDYLMKQLDDNAALTKQDTLAVEKMLIDLSADAKSLRVYCVSHAHIDMNWMWGYQETAAITVDTFRTVLNLMKEYPSLTFAQSQASTYRIIEQFAPEMLDEIRGYVHEGRWEVSASTWVEADKNMTSGESLSRHILYTKRYLSKLLGIDPDTLRLDFEPDTFGHNANVPEILQNGGVDYYYHCRASKDPADVYRWQSPSGKEVLVHRDPKGYNSFIEVDTFVDIPLFCKKCGGTDTFLKVYGVGDHGGGPTRKDLDRILDDASFPLYPDIQFGTYAKYFAALEKFRENFPIIRDERNFTFTGCYTTQTRIKLANRIGEARAYDSEALVAAAGELVHAPAKTASFASAWESILFNQFHDILPGSGKTDTVEYSMGRFQEAMAYINTNANSAMRAIADQMDTSALPFDAGNGAISEGGGVGYAVNHESGFSFPMTERGRGKLRALHLFNPTMYDRDEMVEVKVWDYSYDMNQAYITDSQGNEVEFVLLEQSKWFWFHYATRLLIRVKVPAFGYSTYILNQRPYDGIRSIATTDHDFLCEINEDTPFVLENDLLRAAFDPITFAMTSLIDKECGEEIVTADKPAAIFRLITENPIYGMTSWRVGPYMRVEDLNSAAYNVRLLENKNLGCYQSIKYEIKFLSSKLTVLASLAKGDARVKFDVEVDWHELGNGDKGIPQLNFYLPIAYAVSNYRHDIALGDIERDAIAHDVPALSYMRAESGKAHSAYLVCDSKYGFRGNGNAIALTLIRASFDPEPHPEQGIHYIHMGVGVSTPENQRTAAATFCHPISFCSGTQHKGTLPLDGTAFTLDCDRTKVMVSAIKHGEDGGLVLRLKNLCKEEQHVKLTLRREIASASLVDITEAHTLYECTVNGNSAEACIAPFAIATILIK